MKEKNSQLSSPDIVMILPLLDFLLRFLALKGLCHELGRRKSALRHLFSVSLAEKGVLVEIT